MNHPISKRVEEKMSSRGSYDFEVSTGSHLVDHAENVERLRKLFMDGEIISGKFGPGDPGDFDHGSWHILCHLLGGTGVFRVDEKTLWAGITHKGPPDEYQASLGFRDANGVRTIPLNSNEGLDLVRRAVLQGFIEGSSCGHILARGIADSVAVFNGWRRQDFDQNASSDKEGGTVWEFWCPTRDIRKSCAVGDSLVRGYLTLLSVLGGAFAAVIARGRRAHEHPWQLCAMVKAGLLLKEETLLDVTPKPVPAAIQKILYEAKVENYLKAAETLPWQPEGGPNYFMFRRSIDSWSSASAVRQDLASFDME
jgi:hypothetical protein